MPATGTLAISSTDTAVHAPPLPSQGATGIEDATSPRNEEIKGEVKVFECSMKLCFHCSTNGNLCCKNGDPLCYANDRETDLSFLATDFFLLNGNAP